MRTPRRAIRFPPLSPECDRSRYLRARRHPADGRRSQPASTELVTRVVVASLLPAHPWRTVTPRAGHYVLGLGRLQPSLLSELRHQQSIDDRFHVVEPIRAQPNELAQHVEAVGEAVGTLLGPGKLIGDAVDP